MSNIKERYIACIVLHALGDTIGYKNGDWEFNYFYKNRTAFSVEYSDDMLYEFIELGGVNQINLKGWNVSDDTLFHMATGNALLHKNFINALIDEFIQVYKEIKKEGSIERHAGNRTMTSIHNLINDKKTKWNEIPYQWNKASGSGASMRTSCIGLIYYNNEDKLIETAIEASRLTHNNTIAYLGGLVSALFTAYAINGVSVYKWAYKLVKLLQSDKIDNYIKKTRGYKEYVKEKDIFIDYWRRYIELRFTDKGEFISRKSMRIPSQRSIFYKEHFLKDKTLYPGNLGHDSVIIAYDALVDADDNWEKLIVYSMLHFGDSDTTGCIAASWYGALYGFKNVPQDNIKYLEFKKELVNLGKSLYKKLNK